MNTPHTKSSVRDHARANRRAGPAADPHALADRVLEFLQRLPGPQRVTCYASYGTEPDTSILRERLASAGYDVLLPRVNGADMEWVMDEGCHATSSMGIAEPTGPSVPLLPVRAMLIPALSVTLAGDRLGKGGGYYDRALTSLEPDRPPVAVLVRDDDIVATLPTEPHDQPLDVIITPTRVVSCP